MDCCAKLTSFLTAVATIAVAGNAGGTGNRLRTLAKRDLMFRSHGSLPELPTEMSIEYKQKSWLFRPNGGRQTEIRVQEESQPIDLKGLTSRRELLRGVRTSQHWRVFWSGSQKELERANESGEAGWLRALEFSRGTAGILRVAGFAPRRFVFEGGKLEAPWVHKEQIVATPPVVMREGQLGLSQVVGLGFAPVGARVTVANLNLQGAEEAVSGVVSRSGSIRLDVPVQGPHDVFRMTLSYPYEDSPEREFDFMLPRLKSLTYAPVVH